MKFSQVNTSVIRERFMNAGEIHDIPKRTLHTHMQWKGHKTQQIVPAGFATWSNDKTL